MVPSLGCGRIDEGGVGSIAGAWYAVIAGGMLGQTLAVRDGPPSVLRLLAPSVAQSPAPACCCESLAEAALGTAVSSKRRATSEHLRVQRPSAGLSLLGPQ